LRAGAPSSSAQLCLTTRPARPQPASIIVPWTTQNGTALGGIDFVPASGSVTFVPSGLTEFIISSYILGDDAYEADETYTVAISPPAAYADANASVATVVILDDDLVGGGPAGSRARGRAGPRGRRRAPAYIAWGPLPSGSVPAR
jgi:hypothetical protein